MLDHRMTLHIPRLRVAMMTSGLEDRASKRCTATGSVQHEYATRGAGSSISHDVEVALSRLWTVRLRRGSAVSQILHPTAMSMHLPVDKSEECSPPRLRAVRFVKASSPSLLIKHTLEDHV
jgi:hypothetical protein